MPSLDVVSGELSSLAYLDSLQLLEDALEWKLEQINSHLVPLVSYHPGGRTDRLDRGLYSIIPVDGIRKTF